MTFHSTLRRGSTELENLVSLVKDEIIISTKLLLLLLLLLCLTKEVIRIKHGGRDGPGFGSRYDAMMVYLFIFYESTPQLMSMS